MFTQRTGPRSWDQSRISSYVNIFSSRAHLAEPANAIVGWLLERVLKIRICVSALVEEFEKLGKASKEQLEQGKPPDKYWFWQRYFHTRTMH